MLANCHKYSVKYCSWMHWNSLVKTSCAYVSDILGSHNGKQREEEEIGGFPLHDSSAEEEEDTAASDGEQGAG